MAMRKIVNDSTSNPSDPTDSNLGNNSPSSSHNRYSTLLTNGVNFGHKTTFRVVHGLSTRHPSRLITKAGGNEEEVLPVVRSLSPDEVEIIFSPQVDDGTLNATFWK